MTEFGNLALIDQDAGVEDGVAVPLPGVKKGEQRAPVPPKATAIAGGPAQHPLLPGDSSFAFLLGPQ